MERIFRPKRDAEFEMYYKSENLQNTDFVNYEDLNMQVPDAFVGLSSEMFLNPQSSFFLPDDIEVSQWNRTEKRQL